MKLENISNDEFTIIYRNIKQVEINIKKCKDTVSWKWSNTQNNDEKKNIKSWIKKYEFLKRYWLNESNFTVFYWATKTIPKDINSIIQAKDNQIKSYYNSEIAQ